MIQPSKDDAKIYNEPDETPAEGVAVPEQVKEQRTKIYESLTRLIGTASFYSLVREMNGTLPKWVSGVRAVKSAQGLVNMVVFTKSQPSAREIYRFEANLKQFLNKHPTAVQLILGGTADELTPKMLIAPPGTSPDELSDDELARAFQSIKAEEAKIEPKKTPKKRARINTMAFQLEARRTAPSGVKLWKTSIYEMMDRKGSVYFSVFRLYVPENLKEEAEKWRNRLEKKYRVGIVLHYERVSEGLTNQLSKVADRDGIVRDRDSVGKLIHKIHGAAPTFNINLLPHIRYPDNVRDMTDRPAFSIDPSGAMDLDDLIDGVQLPNGGYRIWVYFADVTHVIKPGDPFDRYAGKVGFSLYGRRQSIPLLGRELGYRYLSLLPESERLSWCVRMDVEPNGKVSDKEFFRAVVKNHRRFTFDEVRFSPEGEVLAPATGQMKILFEVAARLRASRLEKAGFIKFKEEGSAYTIVEEFMLASKAAIAGIFEESGSPILYRVHTPTIPRKELLGRVRSRGIAASRSHFNNPILFRQLLNDIQDSGDMALCHEILDVYLRKSRYDVQNRGHHGLGLPAYTEIKALRNYAGLLNQRQAAHILSDEPPVDEMDMKRWQRIINRKHRTYHDNIIRLITFEGLHERLEQQGREFTTKVESHAPYGLLVSAPGFDSWGLIPFAAEDSAFESHEPGSHIKAIYEGFEPELRRHIFRSVDPNCDKAPLRCTFNGGE